MLREKGGNVLVEGSYHLYSKEDQYTLYSSFPEASPSSCTHAFSASNQVTPGTEALILGETVRYPSAYMPSHRYVLLKHHNAIQMYVAFDHTISYCISGDRAAS